MRQDAGDTATTWMERAKRTLALGRQALESGFFEQVPNRAYYAAFYAATALLTTRGFDPNRHSAVLKLFGREFVVTDAIPPEHGRQLNRLFQERQQADYIAAPDVDQETAKRTLESAEAFVSAASALLDEILAED